MKRKILSVLMAVLVIATLVCAFTFSANAAKEPSVSIDKFNLVFEDNVYLKYAVKFDGVADSKINATNIGMLYFTTPMEDYTKGGEAYSSAVVGYQTIEGEKYYTFEYRHITAKQMTDYIYSVAYIDLDGTRYYSAPVKYSVLEYCYSKLGKTGTVSTNADFRELLSLTLQQGAAAQKYFKYNVNRLASANYYLVKSIDGLLSDGFNKGLYLKEELQDVLDTAPAGETIIYVDETLVIDEKTVFVLNNADAKITIDLGDSVIEGNNDATFTIENVSFRVLDGELEIKGGTINSTGKAYDADGEEMNNVINSDGGVVTVEGTTIDASSATIPVVLSNTTATIKDTTIIANDNAIGTYDGTKLTVENCKIEAQWLAFFASSSGGTASEVMIDGGVYHTTVSNLLGVYGGRIIVKDGVFNCDAASKTFKFYNIDGGTIVLEGGTFNGVAFENLTEDIIRSMCNLSDCAKGVNVTFADGTWTIAVK